MNIIFNKKYEKIFIYWIITLILLIGLIIVVGGLTRLTDSGLSITQWQLFSGIFPPSSENEWIYYFNLYKEIPEFKLQNYSMSMKEFKVIFWWEWIHRFLGRLIGIFFLIAASLNREPTSFSLSPSPPIIIRLIPRIMPIIPNPVRLIITHIGIFQSFFQIRYFHL